MQQQDEKLLLEFQKAMIKFLYVESNYENVRKVSLSDFVVKFDNYEFAKIVDSGDKSKGTDIHTINQKRVGLATRDLAKTFIYSVVYGAGNTKIGDSLWTEDQEVKYTAKEYQEAKEAAVSRICAG